MVRSWIVYFVPFSILKIKQDNIVNEINLICTFQIDEIILGEQS